MDSDCSSDQSCCNNKCQYGPKCIGYLCSTNHQTVNGKGASFVVMEPVCILELIATLQPLLLAQYLAESS